MSVPRFLELPLDFEPTRATLHQYANAIGVIPRAHAEPHDKWWHVSLDVTDQGLETDPMVLPDGESLRIRLDLTEHAVIVDTAGTEAARFAFSDAMTGTEMGDAVINAVADLGLEGQYDRSKFESGDAREYDPAVGSVFFDVLTNIHSLYSVHRDRIGGEVGPLQVWPHGFDLAFEWYGTLIEEHEEDGEIRRYPSQCNFGFFPGGRAYLYANPWPFEAEKLLGVALPGGAEWHTEGWQGSMLNYDDVAGAPDAADRILQYLGAVFAAAEPTLTA